MYKPGGSERRQQRLHSLTQQPRTVPMKILKRLLQAGALLCVLNPAHALVRCSPIVIDLGNNGINLGASRCRRVLRRQRRRRARPRAVGAARRRRRLPRARPQRQWPGRRRRRVVRRRHAADARRDATRRMASSGSRNTMRGSSAATTTASSPKPMPSGRSCASGWTSNADGVSTYDEMRTLKSFGITALETIPKVAQATSMRRAISFPIGPGPCRRARPGRALMVDVFFLQVLP